jgi:hypothetical protein
VIDFDKSPAVNTLRPTSSDGHKPPSVFHNDPLMNTLRTFATGSGAEGKFHFIPGISLLSLSADKSLR